MEEKEKVELSEESEQRIAKAVAKEMKHVSWKHLSVKDILTILIVILVLAGGIYLYHSINSDVSKLETLFHFDNGAEDHDLVLEDNGLLGYTAADFEEAILGDQSSLKKIEVMSQDVSDVATLVDTGLFNWSALTKTQMITYNGHVTYTVDMTSVTKSSIQIDEEEKMITLYIPHAEQGEINIPEDEIQFSDPEKGLLAFGDLKATPEQIAEVQAEARNKMEQKLADENVLEDADRFAKLVVWELYSPIIKGVAKDYSLTVEFAS